jgi:endonuclease/exonuclease/phosphatase (EEP) superfamily protein YafD
VCHASAPTWRRLAVAAVWALAAVGVAWTLIRVFGLEGGYPLVPLIAYTPVVAIGALALLPVALLLRVWAVAVAAALVAVVLAALVLPRAFGDDPHDPSQDVGLTVLASNLHYGEGDPGAVVELVRANDVDVLCIQELTPRATFGLRRAGIDELLPERLLIPESGTEGSGIYSRHPLRESGSGRLAAPGFAMASAVATVPAAGEVELASVHPLPPTGQSAVEEWADGLSALPRATPAAGLRVLAGDFNATLDHAEFRDIVDSGYVDAAEVAGEGLSPTWPADRLLGILPPPVTIDHVLADERIEVGDVSTHEIPESDHRAVLAELFLPPDGVEPAG